MEEYCVTRVLNDGVREHTKYFSGNSQYMNKYDASIDWVDSPTNISVTVMDSVTASQVKEYIEKLEVGSSCIRYEAINLPQMHQLKAAMDDLNLI